MEPNIYIYNELIVKIADVKTATNSGLAKVAVQCSADPEVSGWLIKHLFSASIPIAIGMVKIATFAKRQTVGRYFMSDTNLTEESK